MQGPLKELGHVCPVYTWEDEYIYMILLCKTFAFEQCVVIKSLAAEDSWRKDG